MSQDGWRWVADETMSILRGIDLSRPGHFDPSNVGLPDKYNNKATQRWLY